jgi:hypothetical protein
MDSETLRLARVVYDYHQLRHHPFPADVMAVLGTNDLRVAVHAAALYHGGFAPLLVFTGGEAHGDDLLATGWNRPESEVFADVAVEHGVPRDRILLETRALNTAENIRFTRELLGRHFHRGVSTLPSGDALGVSPPATACPAASASHTTPAPSGDTLCVSPGPRNLLLVCKPFMQRRVWATHAVEWPEMPASISSPELTLDEYFTPELPPEKIVPILLGDLQRIWLYARKGWSAPQRLPAEVAAAYDELVRRGFTQHLVAGENPFSEAGR